MESKTLLDLQLEIKRLHKVCQHKDTVIIAAIEVIKRLLEKWAKPEMPADVKLSYNNLINNFKNEIG
jgi:hypothetical protein